MIIIIIMMIGYQVVCQRIPKIKTNQYWYGITNVSMVLDLLPPHEQALPMLGTGTWFLLTNVLCNLFFNYTRCKDVLSQRMWMVS